ncbi:hypothetical protein M2347_003861 [Chryseobacterium sp. H1D6B]|uniref:glutathione synthase n=1 Tax=Chryseobacterium sp. H1D6B TaxID=2940588 RepID=UPI0015CD8173|nr:glutathione synthase [Chryseobacterium sp. H1D6B]MDH6254134.1 hypothetical protein [Chryseobacterium sp. H1D6B]
MAQREFKKEDFVKSDDSGYQIEYLVGDIGEGIDLIVERKKDDGAYETIQVPIKRSDDKIFVCLDQPVDGRIIYEN